MAARASLSVSLNGLRAFEAVVRLGSVGAAARELGLTLSAVSHQLQTLGAGFPAPLLERHGRHVRPSAAGQALARQLAVPFASIDRAVAEARAARSVLTISAHDSLAAHWLLPRIGQFAAQCPDVDVRLAATARLVDLDREMVDCALRLGPGGWPGVTAQRLLAQTIAPAIRADRLVHGAWPRIVQQGKADEWEDWPGLGGPAQMSVPNRDLTISAVLAGSGMGLVDLLVTADQIGTGAIVPVGAVRATGWHYHLVLPNGRRPGPAVRLFRDWLLAEVEATRLRLEAVNAGL
ncbi:LysR substrate-binding domain-containing protein [Sandarakinorhabdus cyanobacteriorum]|uniref:LysR substrate-binding domain-containing protein n=1 Tax=Sandarakinorhabdus cyanobacteriorum TaxID=1981098 RepID=UPI0013FD98D1|nr:LysR substrate-binding domain-containing protein [Sandarakinorhabdus cyanobacteriorum]